MRTGLKSKKGDVIFDILFISIIIVILGISAMLIYPQLTELRDDIISHSSATATVKNTANTFVNRYPVTMDNSIGLAIVLLAVFVIVSAFFLDTNPVFFIVSAILMIVVLIATFFISNALFDVISGDDFTTSVDNFPITYWVTTHLAHVVLGLFILVGVIIYAKSNA